MTQFRDPTLLSINSTWPGLLADLTLQYGDLQLSASTAERAPMVTSNGNWVQIGGGSSVGSFNIYLPADLCAAILEASDSDLDITRLDGTAAALVFEHVTSHKIEQLQEILGCDLSLTKIVDVSKTVTEPLLGMEIEHSDKKYEAGIHVTGKLAEWFEYVVANNSNLEERSLSDKLSVQLGPVILSDRQAYLVRSGGIIDCGVVPSEIIHGILLREDNRYWPIYIEDASVEIVGPLSGPASFDDVDRSQVFVTFGIGEINLRAVERVKLDIGSRLDVARYEDNEARVYYQTKPFAKGNLTLHGENLAVTLSTIGAFED